MKRFKEPAKTALILLLTLSAVFLAWRGSLFAAFFPPKAQPSPTPTEGSSLSFSAAALPVAAAVTVPGGLRCGIKYDAERMALLYERFGALLAEALGSAGAPEEMGEESWRSQLDRESLFLDYGFSLPLDALAAWVGVEAPWAGDRRADALLLVSAQEGSVRLCFREDGRFFACDTSASRASLRTQLSEYRPNGAAFAFESDKLGSCAPYALVLEQLPDLHAYESSTAQSPAAQALGEAFGINLSSQSRYTETDGTLVYPGDAGVLRLTADGAVTYSAAEGAVSPPERLAGRIEWVRRLLETVRSAWAGEETLRLSAVNAATDGSLRLAFAYELGGLTVELASGPAAVAVWRPGGLSELSLRPLSFRLEDSESGLLPEKQAQAAAGSLHAGGEARLMLTETGAGSFRPAWIVTVEGRSLWTQDG